ncbi:hypothetical protein C8R47DRAFT_1251384, partial [Mycena vitilis]
MRLSLQSPPVASTTNSRTTAVASGSASTSASMIIVGGYAPISIPCTPRTGFCDAVISVSPCRRLITHRCIPPRWDLDWWVTLWGRLRMDGRAYPSSVFRVPQSLALTVLSKVSLPSEWTATRHSFRHLIWAPPTRRSRPVRFKTCTSAPPTRRLPAPRTAAMRIDPRAHPHQFPTPPPNLRIGIRRASRDRFQARCMRSRPAWIMIIIGCTRPLCPKGQERQREVPLAFLLVFLPLARSGDESGQASGSHSQIPTPDCRCRLRDPALPTRRSYSLHAGLDPQRRRCVMQNWFRNGQWMGGCHGGSATEGRVDG